MELLLTRKMQVGKATLGELTRGNEHICFTLEDVVRDLGPNGEGKIMHETAIPAGKYRITMEHSPKFGRVLPLLHDVPFFTGILMHGGNTNKNTWGCILLGDKLDYKTGTIVPGASTPAVARVINIINNTIMNEAIYITIKNKGEE